VSEKPGLCEDTFERWSKVNEVDVKATELQLATPQHRTKAKDLLIHKRDTL
jgi:hypothetical protein